MKASFEAQGNVLFLKFEQDQDEYFQEEHRINMDRTMMELRLPKEWSAGDIHKDHLALITILSIHPFVSKLLEIDWSVSQDFAIEVQNSCSYNITFASTSEAPYVAEKGHPCLAFSGGVDSTAALLLMPKNTLCAWLDRPDLGKRTLYNKTAAKHTMEFTRAQGYSVHEIYCDVEHLRSPVGFPVDLSSGIAAIAIASHTNGNSIAYGMIMETAYRTGHTKYRNYIESNHFKSWDKCFAKAGIPLFLPVSGVSEVGTSTIVKNSVFDGNARSCIRGDWPEQCDNCWKCFRKTLVDYRIMNKPIGNEEMEMWMKVREVKFKLSAWPVSHENVLAWALKNPKVSEGISTLLLERLEGSQRDLHLLSKWYPPALELIPDSEKELFLQTIREYLHEMSQSEILETEALDLRPWLEAEKAHLARELFEKGMSNLV